MTTTCSGVARFRPQRALSSQSENVEIRTFRALKRTIRENLVGKG